MNYHEIIAGRCAHCEKFRLTHEIVEGVCSRSIRKPVSGPSIEVIREVEQLEAKQQLPVRGVPGWNK